jgi:hypothetical protein
MSRPKKEFVFKMFFPLKSDNNGCLLAVDEEVTVVHAHRLLEGFPWPDSILFIDFRRLIIPPSDVFAYGLIGLTLEG